MMPNSENSSSNQLRPLNREQRTKCYLQRDKYIACVEEHANDAIVKDTDGKTNMFNSPSACDNLLKDLLGVCPESWVIHFQLLWGNERLKSKLMGGPLNK
jgi:hypothetical protein